MGETQVDIRKQIKNSFFYDPEKGGEEKQGILEPLLPKIPEQTIDQVDTLYDPEGVGLLAVERLLVLVPDQDVDTAAFAQRVWALANPGQLSIILVTIVPNSDTYSAAQRRLFTIAAITRDRRVKVDTLVIREKKWIQAIRSLHHPNDLIVCHSEQMLYTRFSKKQALSESLVSTFREPVFVLSGLYAEIKPIRSKWLAQIPYWLILLAIIAGFFLFESQVEQSSSGWMEKTITGLLFIIEVGLIWAWNSIMG